MTLIGSVLEDIVNIGIVGGFVLFVIAKIRGQDISDLARDIKDFIIGGKEEIE